MERKSPFFRPGGTMEPDAPSYIEREADRRLLESLLAGEYVFLLDSRQKGKSSLVARTILKLRESKVDAVKLDLQRIGANVTPEQWYAGLLSGIGQELGIGDELFAYWESRLALGPLARWIGAIAEVVLARTSGPIVIFVDEVDFVRALPFQTDEFFAGIRDCFNRRSEVHGFERLTFCLVGVATPGQLIRNPEITPFNVGTRIDLTDFSLQDTERYAKELSDSGRNGAALLGRVHHWVNGHPYLTQLLCSRIASNVNIASGADLDRLVKELFFTPEARQREPNLADIERRMLDPDVPGLSPEERRTQVLELYGRLLRGKGVDASEENPVVASLRLAGVGNEERGALRVRNRIYAHVFDEGWRRQSLPQAELRRMRGAAQMAMLRTASVAGVLLFALTSGAIGVYRISKDREKALKTLALRTDDLSKVSNDRKKALTDLEIRNKALKRVSNERKAALTSLEETNASLGETSKQRQRALADLERQAAKLKQTSEQRQLAISRLETTSELLRAQDYVGAISSLQVAISGERWAQATYLLEKSKSNSRRGWEWGHAAMQVFDGLVFEVQLPTPAVLERQPDGRLWALTYDAMYEVNVDGVQLQRKATWESFHPRTRRGNIRAGSDPRTFNDVFRDVESDKVVGEFSDISSFLIGPCWDGRSILVDPNRSGYGSNQARTPEIAFQIRSVDGKRIVKEFIGPAILSAASLADGSIIWADRTGNVTKVDREGRKLATCQLPEPSFLSISPFHGLSANWKRDVLSYEIRRTSDLGIETTLKCPIQGTKFLTFWKRTKFLVCDNSNIIYVFDLKTGNLVKKIKGFSEQLRSAAFIDENHIATNDNFGLLKVWSLTTKPTIESIPVPEEDISVGLISTSGNELIMGSSKYFYSIDLKTQKQSKLDIEASFWRKFAFHGPNIYLGFEDGHLEKRTFHGLNLINSLRVFPDSMGRTVISQNGKLFAVETKPVPYSNRTEYAFVNLETMKEVSRFKYYWKSKERSNPDFSISADGSLFAVTTNEYNSTDRTGQKNGIIHLVSTTSGNVVGTIQRHDSIFDIELLPDGNSIVVASRFYGFEDYVSIYDTRTLKKTAVMQGSPASNVISDLWMSPNGKYLVGTRSPPDAGLLWDLRKKKLVARLFHGLPVDFVSFAPDGNRVIPRVVGRPTTIWDCETGKELTSLYVKSPTVSDEERSRLTEQAFFSPDGRDVVVVGIDGFVRIFHSLPWKSQLNAPLK